MGEGEGGSGIVVGMSILFVLLALLVSDLSGAESMIDADLQRYCSFCEILVDMVWAPISKATDKTESPICPMRCNAQETVVEEERTTAQKRAKKRLRCYKEYDVNNEKLVLYESGEYENFLLRQASQRNEGTIGHRVHCSHVINRDRRMARK